MAKDWEREQNKLDAMAYQHLRKDVVENPDYFDADTGRVEWEKNAPNDGAVEGTKEQIELQPGDKLVRYDTLDGSYFAPADTKYEELSLPYDESKVQKTYWEVDKSFGVEQSEVKPAFDLEGGGTQYRLNSNDGRNTEYNEAHNWDGEAIPQGSFKDSPSNLAYEGFIHKIDEQEALGEGNQPPSQSSQMEEDKTMAANDRDSVLDKLNSMGHKHVDAETKRNENPQNAREVLRDMRNERANASGKDNPNG